MRQRRERLTLDDIEALELYGVLGQPFVANLELAPWVLSRWMADWPVDDVLTMVGRLNTIHEVLSPSSEARRA